MHFFHLLNCRNNKGLSFQVHGGKVCIAEMWIQCSFEIMIYMSTYGTNVHTHTVKKKILNIIIINKFLKYINY